MILDAHNAHLISVDSPPTPPDPQIGITGGPGPNKWKGDCQAYLDEDITERVIGNQRVEVVETVIDLPANFPFRPQVNDILTFIRIGRYEGQQETLKVRMIDGGLLLQFKLRIRARAD